MKNKNIKQLITRHINQDSLENFFGCIRATGYKNINPTCTGVGAAYKVLLINNLSSRQSLGRNCEDTCDGQLLFTLQQFISRTKREIINIEDIEEESAIPNISCNIETSQSDQEIDVNNVTAIKRKILLKAPFKQCKECELSLSADSTFGKKYIQKCKKLSNKILIKNITVTKLKKDSRKESIRKENGF